jgi:glyoxylase-like metal-dependent hydrolase (beta-lactamase superfamily II)
MALRIRRRDAGRLALGVGAAALLARQPSGAVLAQQAPAGQPAAPSTQSAAELTRLAEDVYVFRSLTHQALFIVTDAGVIATDPIGESNPLSPPLYRASIAAVTDQPVRYVVYSHDHKDHNEGGYVFAGEAEFVAHRLAAPKIAARPDSQEGRSPVPTLLFDQAHTLDLGGKQIELLYLGRNHSDNSVVVHYPARRLVFGVDIIRVNSLPSPAALRLTIPAEERDLWLDGWIESLARVEALDVEVVVPGHPPLMGTKADVTLLREYLADGKAAFQAAAARGVDPSSEAMAAALNDALAPKYGQVGGYANSYPALAQALATARADTR